MRTKGQAAAVAAIAARLQMDAAFEYEAGLPADAGDHDRRSARIACAMRAAAYRARVRELGEIGGADSGVLNVLEEITAQQVAGTRLRALLIECRRLTRGESTDEKGSVT